MNQRQIVINSKHGGFDLSHQAVLRYAELKGLQLQHEPLGFQDLQLYTLNGEHWHPSQIPRDDPQLVQVVQELQQKANGYYSKLHIVTIPQDVPWTIQEYDGLEWVAEQHRTWSA